MASCETYAVLGCRLHRVWFILPFLRRIRKGAIPLAIEIHHAYKIRIGYVGMVRIRAREGVLDAYTDVPVFMGAVRAHLRRIGGIALHGQNPLAKCEVPHPLHDLAAQPVGPLVILAPGAAHVFFRRLVSAQVLEDNHCGVVGEGKIDDLAGNLPRGILVEMAHFLQIGRAHV